MKFHPGLSGIIMFCDIFQMFRYNALSSTFVICLKLKLHSVVVIGKVYE